MVLDLAMVVGLMPMHSFIVYAASYGGSTTINGVDVSVTGDSWTEITGGWWQCCESMGVYLNPTATIENAYFLDIIMCSVYIMEQQRYWTA